MLKKKQSMLIINKIILYAILITITIFMIMPFMNMLTVAVQPVEMANSYPPPLFPKTFTLDNIKRVFEEIPYGRYYLNTIFVAGTITVGQIFICALAAYAFARLKFPGRDILFLLYLGTLMIPYQVLLIPRFLIVKNLGWVNSYYALIIPDLASAFGTFLLRQFFITIPKELDDAAIIDGCSQPRLAFQIIMPLAKPAFVALAIFTFMGAWNNFLWPFLVISEQRLNLLQVGLAAFRGEYFTFPNLLQAGTLLSIIPVLILFIIGQKTFVKGITLTGIKG